MRSIGLAAWFVGAWVLFAPTALACPGCKEAAFDTAEQAQQRMASAKGYGLTIALLLLVPASAVSCVAWKVVGSARKARTASNVVFDRHQGSS